MGRRLRIDNFNAAVRNFRLLGPVRVLARGVATGAAGPLPLAFVAGDLNAAPQTSTHIYKEMEARGFVDAL